MPIRDHNAYLEEATARGHSRAQAKRVLAAVKADHARTGTGAAGMFAEALRRLDGAPARNGTDTVPPGFEPDPSSTLAHMIAAWDGDPADYVGMVGSLAFTIATEEDLVLKGRLSGPVQTYVKEHGPCTVPDIVTGLGLDPAVFLVPVALVVDMHREIGIAFAHGNHTWSYTPPPTEGGTGRNSGAGGAVAFGLTPGVQAGSLDGLLSGLMGAMAGTDDRRQAAEFLPRVRQAFTDHPDRDMTMSDVGGLTDIGAEFALGLRMCLGELEEAGEIVQTGERYGSGPTWRRRRA